MDAGPEATTSGLVVRDLVVRLGAQTVLDGVDLRVAPGRVVVVRGPSGAGKSTLLRGLVRLVEPAGGEVRLDGADVRTLEARVLRRRVGLVAQAPVMLSGTVAGNLRYANAALSEDGLVRALAQAGLGPAFAARSATALSGGERARVAVARALARAPEVLLLDEPTAALDAVAAGHLAETILGLARDGLAICIATHDAALEAAVADDRLVLA